MAFGKHTDPKVGKQFPEQDPTKGGAPKGKRISTILKELLNGNLDNIIDNPDLQGKNGKEALAIQLLILAFHKESSPNEKLSAIKEIINMIEKPKQEIEQSCTIQFTEPKWETKNAKK